MIRFLSPDNVWPRITELARRTPQAMVAVAYFGQEAGRLLPLKPGSVLVVDAHPGSVKAGQTCPSELLKLIKKKVEVHSCSNLHAKVFVFGSRAIIGSANASNFSKSYLLEAAVETSDSGVVSACKEFIQSLRGDQITPQYAKLLSKIWNPPKVPGTKKKRPRGPTFHPLWAVPLVRTEWEPVDNEKDQQAEPLAREKLTKSRRFVLNKILWQGSDALMTEVRPGHQLIQVIDEGKTTRVYPPARVIHIEKYIGGRANRIIVYLQAPVVKPAYRSLETVNKSLAKMERSLNLGVAARRIRNLRVARTLYQLWPGEHLDI